MKVHLNLNLTSLCRVRCVLCVSSAPSQKPEDVIKKYMEAVPVVPDEVCFKNSNNTSVSHIIGM